MLVHATLQVIRSASSGTRQYGIFSDVSKKSQEAIEKAKEAAEQLKAVSEAAKVAQETAEQLKQQAAKATSSFSEKVSQAQGLARETMAEMLKSDDKSKGANSESTASKSTETTQNQQQEEQKTESSSSSSQHQHTDDNTPQPSFSERLRGFAASAVQEMKAAVLPEDRASSAFKGAVAKATDFKSSDKTDLVLNKTQPESGWQKQWRDMASKLSGHPMFQSMKGLKDSKVFEKGRDVAEGIREKWETSDSSIVHRIQDATDSMFAENEGAQALREIRARDPNFDMVDFLKQVKHDVPTLIKAYLEGDEAIIKEHCSAEMIERLLGIAKAQQAAGLVSDPTLLDVGEVELVDLKMFEDQPIVVVQFHCQQINCTRDSFGNVVEGAPDEVHRVYYYWALQQEAAGYVGEDGGYHPPRWQLRELLIRGMHHLL